MGSEMCIRDSLPTGGLVYGASDVPRVALEMRKALEACGGEGGRAFVPHALHTQPAWCAPGASAAMRALDGADDAGGDRDGDGGETRGRTWLARTPFGIPTERELVCEVAWRPVLRFLLRRTEVAVDAPLGEGLGSGVRLRVRTVGPEQPAG